MKKSMATPNEPLIKDRVQQYMDENGRRYNLNMEEMTKVLHSKYPEYKKYKMKTFRSIVEEAHKLVLQSYERVHDGDSGSDIEFFNVSEHSRSPTYPSSSDGYDRSKPGSPIKRRRSGSFESDKSDEPDDIPDKRRRWPRLFVNCAVPQCTFKDVFGLDSVIKQLSQILLHFKQGQIYEMENVIPPIGILLHGASGCGKSHIAKCIAGHLMYPFVELPAMEILSIANPAGAESRLYEYFNFSFEKAPCVLFIDDIDLIGSIFHQQDMERRLSYHLVNCMDRIIKECHKVLVVATTNRLDVIEPALKRPGRFDNEIAIGLPNRVGRAQMIKHIALEMGLGETFPCNELAALTPGFIMSELQMLAARAASTGIQRFWEYESRECPTVLHKFNDRVRNVPVVVQTKGVRKKLLNKKLSVHSGEASNAPNKKIKGNRIVDKTPDEVSVHSGEASNAPNKKIKGNRIVDKTPDEVSVHSGEASNAPNKKIKGNRIVDKTPDEVSVHSGEASNAPNKKIKGNRIVDKMPDEISGIVNATTDDAHEKEVKLDIKTETVEVVQEQTVEKIEEKGNEDSIKKITTDNVEEKIEGQSDVTESTSTTPLENVPAQMMDVDQVDDLPTQLAKDEELIVEVEKEVVASTSQIALRSSLDENESDLHVSHESYVGLFHTDLENGKHSEVVLDKDALNVTFEDFCNALKYVTPNTKGEGFIVVPNVKWKDVGSFHIIQDELRLEVIAPIKYPKRFQQLGLTPASGILLFGPTGCGKTFLARKIVDEAGVNFISINGPELLNMYDGENENALRLYFQRAKTLAPCVIFFDELDSLCCDYFEESEPGNSTVIVNQLLAEMDDPEDRLGVFILAATNRPDKLDPEILRPGRLEKILYVGMPNEKDRCDILRTVTNDGKEPRLHEEVDIRSLSLLTDGFTGTDLVALIEKASNFAFEESLFKVDHNFGKICITHANLMAAMHDIIAAVTWQDKHICDTFNAIYESQHLHALPHEG